MERKIINMDESAEPTFGSRDTGMTVPDGFFDDFARRMEAVIDADMARSGAAEPHSQVVLPAATRSMWQWRRYVGIAASVAVIVAISALLHFGRTAHEAPMSLSQTVTTESEGNYGELASDSDDMLLASLSDFDIYETFYEME